MIQAILAVFFTICGFYDYLHSSSLIALIDLLIASVLYVGFSVTRFHKSYKLFMGLK